MNIHISWLALCVLCGGIVAIIIGGVAGLLSIADDSFLPVPFTRDKIHGGMKLWEVPGWLLMLFVPLFYLGVLAIVVSFGIQIAVWVHAS